MSPLQHTGLGFRAPLIFFGGIIGPSRIPEDLLPRTTASTDTANVCGHTGSSLPLQLYKASPLCHQAVISIWGFLPKEITLVSATMMESSSTDQETCQQLATTPQSSAEKQLSSPVSSTSPTTLAFLKSFSKRLI